MIRTSLPSDSPTLVSITRDTGLFKPIEIQALAEVLEDYHDVNQDLGHRCITMEAAGQIQGFAYYAPAAMTDRTWYLWWIVVRKDIQARGIGGTLLKLLEADIAAQSGRVLFVETGSLPHYELTRRFYHKHGYEKHAELKDYYAAGDSMVVFRKTMAGNDAC